MSDRIEDPFEQRVRAEIRQALMREFSVLPEGEKRIARLPVFAHDLASRVLRAVGVSGRKLEVSMPSQLEERGQPVAEILPLVLIWRGYRGARSLTFEADRSTGHIDWTLDMETVPLAAGKLDPEMEHALEAFDDLICRLIRGPLAD